MTMRAVIYARYSSDLQRAASIEDQVRLCRARIEREGWTLESVYTDHATSGASRLRPGYQKLLEDARAACFDVVVAEAMDRLSRDQEDIAALYKQLSFAGVRLSTIAEGEVSELHVGLKGTMNALFLKDLAAKTHRGLEGRVRQGRSAGGNSYGYQVVPSLGQPEATGRRRIIQSEAAVVRRIFEDYTIGSSPRAIAQALNREGVSGPSGRAWGPSTINGNGTRGTGILNNELYVGRLVWNRLRYVKDPETGKRVSRLNPQSAWIVEEVPDLRIVDDELWQRVKARQKAATRNTRPDCGDEVPAWDRRRPRYLFSGLARCGACGGGFVVISRTLYGCANARNKGTCTNRLNIRRDVLEATVLDGLAHHLMDPDLFRTFAEEFHKEVNRLRSGEAHRLERLRAQAAGIERKIASIIQAVEDGLYNASMKGRMAELEARKAEIEEALKTAKAPKPLIHPNLAKVYRDKVVALHAALASEATRMEAAEIIRSLVERIVLTPEAGALRIDLEGALAGILSVATNAKRPADVRAVREQIALVAGARSHLYRTEFDWRRSGAQMGHRLKAERYRQNVRRGGAYEI